MRSITGKKLLGKFLATRNILRKDDPTYSPMLKEHGLKTVLDMRSISYKDKLSQEFEIITFRTGRGGSEAPAPIYYNIGSNTFEVCQ